MIARAKRAFPGMVLSLMLSAPALGTAQAAEKATQVPHRPLAVGAASSRKVVKSATSKDVASSSVPRVKVLPKPVVALAGKPVANPHAMPSAQPQPRAKRAGEVVPSISGRLVHRASAHVSGTQLIDDGTLWRESGAAMTWQQTGVASWYGGKRWQGHRMSSGARYDENALTAAHATLPIGTRVRVVLLDSQRDVIVTITDRPGTRSRIIDLSRKAAEELGILSRGVAMVTLQPL